MAFISGNGFITGNGFIRINTVLQFWGYNCSGQFGNGNTDTLTDPPTLNYFIKPTQINISDDITSIFINNGMCLASNRRGNVLFWGHNTYGCLGNGNTGTTTVPTNVNCYITPTQINGLQNIIAVSLFFQVSTGCLALDNTGNVWFWGQNTNGQFGNGSKNNYYMTPTRISGLQNITAISIGYTACLALDTTGNVWFWGLNYYGQLGNGNTGNTTIPVRSTNTPTQITGLQNITFIFMHFTGCLAVDKNGNVWFWGQNTNGNLGNDNTGTITPPPSNNFYMTPTQITGLQNIITVTMTNVAFLALDRNGNVWFWGKNTCGQLGNDNTGTSTASPTANCYIRPTQITGLQNITAIAAGYWACLALDNTGNVWFWGLNSYGQFGNGNNSPSINSLLRNSWLKPTKITGLSNISSISMAFFGCLAF